MFPFQFLSDLREQGPKPLTPISNQRGVTYLVMMFLVVLLGISLMAMNQHWSIILKRDREKELAFRGKRIKEAIERYVDDYEVQKGTRESRYPLTLEDLTKQPKRYLQTAYKDPLTGKKFDVIRTDMGIRGVRSPSHDRPFDQVTFQGAQRYHDIRFEASDNPGRGSGNE